MLPSEVLSKATTYDLMADDVYSTWLLHENNKGQPGYTAPAPDSITLEEMMRKFKEGKS